MSKKYKESGRLAIFLTALSMGINFASAGSDLAFDGPIHAVAQSNGKVYLGGSFTSIATVSGSGVMIDQSSNKVNPWPFVDGTIHAVVSDGTGGWFIGGEFNEINGHPRPSLARIRRDGTLDTAWIPEGDVYTVLSLALSEKYLYVGYYHSKKVSRYDKTTGSQDTSFESDNSTNVRSIVLHGGKVYVAGTEHKLDYKLVCYDEEKGKKDTGWIIPQFYGQVKSLAVDENFVYAEGDFSIRASELGDYNHLVRFRKNGTIDPGWHPSLHPARRGPIVLNGEKLYVGNERFNTDDTGTRDLFWDLSINSDITAMSIFEDKIYVSGSGLSRFHLNGSRDRLWTPPQPGGPIYGMVVDREKIFVGGSFSSFGVMPVKPLVRFNATDGTLDASWEMPGSEKHKVHSLLIDDESIYVGISGSVHKIKEDGYSDDNWTAPELPRLSEVLSLALSGDKLYIGAGNFEENKLLRVNKTSGDRDTGWNTPNLDGGILSLVVHNNRVIAGGTFKRIGTTVTPYLASFGVVSGELDYSWGPGDSPSDGWENGDMNGPVRALSVYDGKVYVGGDFNQIGSSPANYFARMNEDDGELDLSWRSDYPGGPVLDLAMNNENIYIGGDFTHDKHPLKLLNTLTGKSITTWDGIEDKMIIQTMDFSGDSLVVAGHLRDKEYWTVKFLKLSNKHPSTPADLIVTDVTSQQASLAWKPGALASSYLIEATTVLTETPTHPIASPLSESKTRGQIINLMPNTVYYFFVQSINSDGFSGYVRSAPCTTLAEKPGLHIQKILDNSATFTVEPNKNPLGTVYEIDKKKKGDSFTLALTTTSLNFTLGGLSAESKYEFRIRARNHEGIATAYSSPYEGETVKPAITTVAEARAYPVPFRPESNHSSMTFDQIPMGSTIRVYTMSGTLVKELWAETESVQWDVKNDGGEDASSGVYIVRVSGSGGNKTFKIMVQR